MSLSIKEAAPFAQTPGERLASAGWSFQILIDWRNSQALSSCRAAKKHISARRGHSFRIIPSKRANTIL